MKPPICYLCNKDFRSASWHLNEGGLVQFANFRPLAEGAAGHPFGLEWFCKLHYEAAQMLTELPVEHALSALKLQFGEFPPYQPQPQLDPELWVLNVGINPAKVFTAIRQGTFLSPKTVKEMLDIGEFRVTTGWPSHFKKLQGELRNAGATVEIRCP